MPTAVPLMHHSRVPLETIKCPLQNDNKAAKLTPLSFVLDKMRLNLPITHDKVPSGDP